MKPTLLKPGRQVRSDGCVMTFVRRERAQCGQAALNVFQCEDYRGLNGPEDAGVCTMTDARVARHVEALS